MRFFLFFALVLLFLLSFRVSAVSSDCCYFPSSTVRQPVKVHFVPANISDYNVTCRLFDISAGTFYGPFPIPSSGILDLNGLPGMTLSDPATLCYPNRYNLVCVQSPSCSNGAYLTIPNLVFTINKDIMNSCIPVPDNQPSPTSWSCSGYDCYLIWNSYANPSICTPSPTPVVTDTSTPTPIVTVTPSPSVTPTVTDTSTPIPTLIVTDTSTPTPSDVPTPTPDDSGNNNGGGGGTYITGPSITTCNAHFPFLDDYSCTITNLETKEVTALTLCNSNKNFACTSRWNMPGNLKCGNNYQISCSKNIRCFKDLQLKDFKILFTATCNPSSQVEGCVFNGDCILNDPYHTRETFVSSNFDSTYCGFSRVLEKSTFCSVNNDEFLKKGPVTANLSANLVPFSNSILNNVFGSSKKEVGVGNNSFDQNAQKGTKVNSSDLEFAGVNDQLVKIRSNSNSELDKLSSTLQFLLYKLLPILGVLSVVGLVVFLIRKRKLVVFRVASKSIPISNANVMISVNDKTYSETTDYNGYVNFHLSIEENAELKVQSFVSVNDIKLVSKLYTVVYDSTKEIQELLVFDEKSIVSS